MSKYRFIAYSDFELTPNSTALNLPFELYIPTKRTSTEELSTELNIPYTVFEILVAIIAIIGNLMVIVVFQRERKLRRRTNYYIVSLAIADFLVGLLGVPFAILASVGLPTNLHACLFTVSLLVVLCTISIFCLVAVSIDRYWAILHPMAYSRNVRTKTAIGIISLCWVAGTIVGFLPLFGWHAGTEENAVCLFVKVMDYNYLVFLYFATIITPAILMLAFYAHIYRVIIRQVRQIVTMNPVGDSTRRTSSTHIQVTPHRTHGGTMLRVLGAARKREVKATQNLSIIVLFFMICWIPLYTINCVKAFCPECYVHPKLTFFCIILSHLNSAVNPVLYAYHLKDFRAALKTLILKILGVEVDQTADLNYRVSLASQQRLQSMIEKRSSLQNRIYIDSPVWLRQQQQQQAAKNTSAITCSLSSVHQTVAAVASATAEINKDIWRIPEVPSAAEQSSRCNISKDSTPSYSLQDDSFKPSETNGIQYSFDNNEFTSSLNDYMDDEVFLPSSPTGIQINDDSSPTSCLHDKIRTENDKFDYYNKSLPISDSFSDYDNIQVQMSSRHQNPLASDSTSIQSYTTTRNGSVQSDNSDKSDFNPLRQSAGQLSNSVFVIENDRHPLSPVHRSRIRKTSKLSSPFGTRASVNRMQRSTSCTNSCELTNNNVEKFSPLKVVSNLIFPPVKHSSLFHIFDTHKSSENTFEKKRTSSDS